MPPSYDPASAPHGRPVRIRHLNDPPEDDLSDVLGLVERIELVWVLSRRMWEITGQPVPAYDRTSIPVHVVRPG